MTVKRNLTAVVITMVFIFATCVGHAQRVKTVVVDAGHGGHDTGALGKNSREKDITLDIALKLRDYIIQNLRDVKVILTRDSDVFVELYKRARIANTNNADLFISIHCNSARSPQPFGTETFVMGLHKSEANLAVAKTENSAILLEDDYVQQYDGFDPNSPEGNIFFAMMQNAFLDNSLLFAGKVQRQFAVQLNKLDRGVKQAGFLVLYKTAMPGVLVEAGFLSNPDDEKYLLSEKGRSQIAAAIGKALHEYKSAIEKIQGELAEKPNKMQQETPDDTKTNTGKTDSGKSGNTSGITTVTGEREKEVSQPAKTSEKLPADKLPGTDPAMPSSGPATGVAKPGDSNIQKPSMPKSGELVFKVQIATSPALMALNSPDFKKLGDIEYYFHQGLYKYTSGKFKSLDEANNYRQTMVDKGFKDAFVVAFLGKERITIAEARKITGN